MNKKIIIAIIVILILVLGVYQIFLKKEKEAFTLAEVIWGNVVQEISETGQVKKGEEIKLSFKNAGKIEKIYVTVGEKVKAGAALVKLEDRDLRIQLNEAKAVLDLNQAKLNKLLAGVSKEEIQKSQTAISNAETSLKNYQQNLQNVKSQAEENLNAAYEDALNTLDDAYLKAYNSQNTVDLIQRTYFTNNDQAGIRVRENKEKIVLVCSQIKSSIDTAKTDSTHENIDLALSQTEDKLSDISDSLKTIREICEEINYRSVVSSSDKTSLDTHRSNINTALTNITNSQQTIALTKLTNTTNINTAQTSVSTAEGTLKTVQNEFTLLTAPPRIEDIDLYQAQVSQAQAQVNILENQLQETILRSPVEGEITQIKKRIGEMIQPMLQDSVITLLPTAPFEIEVDIYEEDVVKMSVGNEVDISLVAFPEKTFKGKVLAIEPAEKLIEGVVYYEVRITFEEIPEGVKPGMTADLVIKTAQRENVLIIPQDALQKKDGKTMVEVLKGDKAEEREVEIGLKGSNDKVEVISGLEEGEKVVIR